MCPILYSLRMDWFLEGRHGIGTFWKLRVFLNYAFLKKKKKILKINFKKGSLKKKSEKSVTYWRLVFYGSLENFWFEKVERSKAARVCLGFKSVQGELKYLF